MMEVNTIDIRDEVVAHLKSIERNIAWLARKIGVKYATLYSILVQKTINLSDDNRKAINKVLKTNF